MRGGKIRQLTLGSSLLSKLFSNQTRDGVWQEGRNYKVIMEECQISLFNQTTKFSNTRRGVSGGELQGHNGRMPKLNLESNNNQGLKTSGES